jgi:hypothetical protein
VVPDALSPDLTDRLRLARRVVPEPDPEAWVRSYTALRDALRHHLREEESRVLPAFDLLADQAAPNQRPHVVRADHRRIEAVLADLDAEADRVRRAIVLAHLADVLRHHDLREAAGMLVVLAETPAGDAAVALHAFASPVPPAPAGLVTGARAPPEAVPADPLLALVTAGAHDQPLGDAFARLAVPEHRRGPALHARLADAVAAADTEDVGARRDALGIVVERARLLRIVRDIGR